MKVEANIMKVTSGIFLYHVALAGLLENTVYYSRSL